MVKQFLLHIVLLFQCNFYVFFFLGRSCFCCIRRTSPITVLFIFISLLMVTNCSSMLFHQNHRLLLLLFFCLCWVFLLLCCLILVCIFLVLYLLQSILFLLVKLSLDLLAAILKVWRCLCRSSLLSTIRTATTIKPTIFV